MARQGEIYFVLSAPPEVLDEAVVDRVRAKFRRSKDKKFTKTTSKKYPKQYKVGHMYSVPWDFKSTLTGLDVRIDRKGPFKKDYHIHVNIPDIKNDAPSSANHRPRLVVHLIFPSGSEYKEDNKFWFDKKGARWVVRTYMDMGTAEGNFSVKTAKQSRNDAYDWLQKRSYKKD